MAGMGKKLRIVFLFIVAAGLLMCAVEAYRQIQEDRYIDDLAGRIVSQAGARTPLEKVTALREHILNNVRFQGAAYDDRPFFRATAAETLQSGLGYCGEVTRAFINLAGAEGIRAQRINLWGRTPHVVAEAELSRGDNVIVDCQYPPMIPKLEKLDNVILSPDFDDYYTLNLRRLHLNWLMTRVRTRLGPATYWLENPHALKSFLWGGSVALLLVFWFATGCFRKLLRSFLLRRGWVHRSSFEAHSTVA
ncbi:MAG: transglutaminase domain-containing protein [Blastocatellales bacterium]